ncbi:transporter substrate-binding domain-containing protein [Paenibacillus sp. NPDC058071]|uniref:transporter substrate-binding domain-containing protein n=1 Tax=Paenibacillus sp. NPDC058071 TaxID=3346326 RepID=UPI0036D7B877
MKKKSIAIIMASVLLAVLAGCGGKAEEAPAGGKDSKQTVIKVALNNVPNPPFIFKDDKDNSVGYTVDYFKELEKKFPEYKFEYDLVDKEAQILGVDTGKYTLTGNLFKNPEREKKFHFAGKEFGYYITALVVDKNRDDIHSLDDMGGKKLAPLPIADALRSIINDYNKAHPGKEVQIEDIEKFVVGDSLKVVANGKVDAALLNVNQFEEANKKMQLDLKVGGIVSKEPIFLMYNKQQTELAAEFDKATEELLQDGTLSKLADKWLGVDFFKDVDSVNEGYKFRQSK